jgi:hypothetical protein
LSDQCKRFLPSYTNYQKIGSSVIANRIKNLLDKLISSSQKVFLKGRYIGECTRLIVDLIERAEEENIPGIMLLLDFEKASMPQPCPEPNQTACVLSKLALKPPQSPNLSNMCTHKKH